jgi:rod shape-determining protein MreC
VSTVLIVLETNTRLLEPVRSAIATVVEPLRWIAESPYLLTSQVGEVASSRGELQQRNAELERRVLELSRAAQQLQALLAENDRLRELLGSRARLTADVLVAEIIGVLPAVNTHQVVIDKGSRAGVRLGDAIIDASGLFGQVVEVSRFSSRVMLVIDVNHAVPVQVNRNGVRSIAGGTGRFDELHLENVSITADIRVGDLLETSGLGGRFPPGYPVGTVTEMAVEPTAAYAAVTVRPLAELDRSRHVLVVLSGEQPADHPEDDSADDSAGSGDAAAAPEVAP